MAFVKIPIRNWYQDPVTNVAYEGAVLVAYEINTTTRITLYTDYTGGTSATEFALDSEGFTQTSGGTQIYPHISTTNARADFVLFKTQAYADAGTVNSSTTLFVWEDIAVIEQSGEKIFETVAAMVADTGLVVGDHVRTLGYTAIGDGGGNE